jgi:hypothetical protein
LVWSDSSALLISGKDRAAFRLNSWNWRSLFSGIHQIGSIRWFELIAESIKGGAKENRSSSKFDKLHDGVHPPLHPHPKKNHLSGFCFRLLCSSGVSNGFWTNLCFAFATFPNVALAFCSGKGAIDLFINYSDWHRSSEGLQRKGGSLNTLTPPRTTDTTGWRDLFPKPFAAVHRTLSLRFSFV